MSNESRFCDQCGRVITSLDSKFCPSCGSDLSDAKSAPTNSSVPRETVFGSDRKGSPFPRIILAVISFLISPIGLIGGLWYMLKKKEKGFGGLLLSLGIISLLIVVAAPSDNASDSGNSTSNASEAKPTPAPSVSYHFLIAEREANATRFDATYKGKYVELNAVVIAIDSGYVRIAGPHEFLDDGAIKGIPTDVQMQLEKGTRIKAVCKVGRFTLGTMFFDSCILPITIG